MDTASSNYNSLEGKLNQRLSNGLVYSLGITWMKSIDYGSALRGGFLWPYNSYDLQQLRGVSDFDVPLRFVANFVYDLPVGPGKSILSHGVAGAIIGGWQVGGIVTAYSGLPTNGPHWVTRPAWARWRMRAITRESVPSRRIATCSTGGTRRPSIARVQT